MYLRRKTYIGNDYCPPEKRVRVVVPEDQEGSFFPIKYPIHDEYVSEITETLAYWRKANAIHRWFVINVQNGNDDCGEYYVTTEQLQSLLDTVNRVLDASKMVGDAVVSGYTISRDGSWVPNVESGEVIEDPTVAAQLLPVAEGFFFGGYDYDQWYYEKLVYTRDRLTAILAEPDGYLYYHSSW